MALINFDNAIELSVSTFLDLNPKQRAGVAFRREDVDRWLTNFHTRLDFVENFVTSVTKQGMQHDKLAILFFHDLRNRIYHREGALRPRFEHVEAARDAAVWVFGALFGIDADAFLAAETAGTAVEIPETREPPPESKLFELYLDLKQEVEELKSAMTQQGRAAVTDEQIIEEIASTADTETGKRLTEAFHRSDEVVQALTDTQSIKPSAEELDELGTLMKELKDHISQALRQHNQRLAEHAARSTVVAVERGEHTIGVVSQSLGTGLALTAAAYVDLISRHSNLRQFSLLVVGDRRALVKQLYERCRRIFAETSRPVLRIGSDALEILKQGSLPCVAIGTVQALSRAMEEGVLLRNTIVISVYFDVFSHPIAERLQGQFLISFTNVARSILRSGVPVIGNYSFKEAVVDGALVPVQIFIKDLFWRGWKEEELILRAELRANLPDDLCLYDEVDKSFQRSPLTPRDVDLLAKDVVEDHFGPRNRRKSLLVVNSIEIGQAFVSALRRAALELDKTGAFVEILSSENEYPDNTYLEAVFDSPHSSVSLLVVIRMWPRLAARTVTCVYLTCRVAGQEMKRLVESLSVPRDGKEAAVIVDYYENEYLV